MDAASSLTGDELLDALYRSLAVTEARLRIILAAIDSLEEFRPPPPPTRQTGTSASESRARLGEAARLEPSPAPTNSRQTDAVRAADRERKRRARALARGGPAKAGPKHDYAEVATVARSAHAAGDSMAAVVAETLDTSKAMAQWLIGEARRRGHDIPSGRNLPRNRNARTAERDSDLDHPPVESGLGPIGHLLVDHDRAREAAVGMRFTVPAAGQIGWASPARKLPALPPVTFTLDDARAVIGAGQ